MFRQRYWARNHVGWRRMDRNSPNAGHRALAAPEPTGIVLGVITQNVDPLHTKAGSRTVIPRPHGDGLATVKVDSGCSPILTLLADELIDTTGVVA